MKTHLNRRGSGACMSTSYCTLIALCIWAVAMVSDATAQSTGWKPVGPVELVVPSGAGSALDTTGRILQQIMQSEKLVDSPIIVRNQPGAGQAIGYQRVRQHGADGQMLGMVTMNLLTNQIMGTSPLHHSEFSQLSILSSEYYIFVVKTDTPLARGMSLIQLIRTDASSISVGLSNLGGAGHVATALMFRAVGGDARKIRSVPYNSGGQALIALIGGHIDHVATSASNAASHILAGKLHAVAIAAPKRLSGSLGEVPTWRELGVDLVVGGWQGIMVAKGVPHDRTMFWESALAKATATPTWKQFLERRLADSVFIAGTAAAQFIEQEDNKLSTLFREIGLAKQ